MRYKDVQCKDRGSVIEVILGNRTLIVGKESGNIYGIGEVALNGCAAQLLKAVAVVGKNCGALLAIAEALKEEGECTQDALAHLIEVL